MSMDTSTDIIRVIGEADLLELAGCARTTWKSWCGKDLLEEADNGLYSEPALLEVVLVRILVAALDLRVAGASWRASRATVVDASSALTLDRDDALDAVVDLHTWELRLARSAEDLYALSRTTAPLASGHAIIPLAPAVRQARRGFAIRAQPVDDLASDKRRKKPST